MDASILALAPTEFLADHTYRTVLLGTVLIGMTAGALGCFAYLRKQALISDVVSHSALPGVLAAFLIASLVFGSDGRSMLWLLIGAIITGVAASLLSNRIADKAPIGHDSAMAVVLVTFFGFGMLLMRVISDGDYAGKGGVQDYLFGNASVLTSGDVWMSAATGAVALAVMAGLWKQFALRTFDPVAAEVAGIPPRFIDAAMFGAVAIATVNGVKAVGLVLMVAFVVTPPAIARQWTHRLGPMVALAGAVGAGASALGAYLSIALGGLPTGPVVVIVLFVAFVYSVAFAPGRSIFALAARRSRLRRQLRADVLAGAEGGAR